MSNGHKGVVLSARNTSRKTTVAGGVSVLFTQYTAQRSGAPLSGLSIVRGLVERGWIARTAFGVDGDLAGAYRDAGSQVMHLSHGQWLVGSTGRQAAKRWWREFEYMRNFVRLIRETRPDVVYVNTLTGLAPALAARWCRVPCVWHIRELFDDVGGEMRPPWPGGKRLVAKLVDRLADRIIVISQAVQDNVLGETAREKTVIVPNAVEERFFAPPVNQQAARRQFGLDPRRPVVGVPGTLRPVKGHAWFLDAAAIVAANVPGCQFAVTGDGTEQYKMALAAQVRELGLDADVRFVGTVTDMPQFLAACDVVCIPSRSEAFGRVAIEAFACGVPVVTSAVGGLTEIVTHGETGLLVEYGKRDDLARAIMTLLENPDLRARLATAARDEAKARYHESVYQSRIVAMVEQVLQRNVRDGDD